MTTKTRQRYVAVNATWSTWTGEGLPNGPAVGIATRRIPPLEPDEAIEAVKRLLRFGGLKIGSRMFRISKRSTWVADKRDAKTGRQVWRVNPDEGWRGIVHAVSHWVHLRKWADRRPHDRRHATIEARMIREVIDRGWLDGELRRELAERRAARDVVQTPDALLLAEIQRLELRRKRWVSKQKRAGTAIRKIDRALKRRTAKLAELKAGAP